MNSDNDHVREMDELFSQLISEIDFVAKVLPNESFGRKRYADPSTLSMIQKRVLIRSVFSLIEAIVFTVKNDALLYDTSNLSPGEIALIKEEDYELDDSGAIRTRKARLRTLNNLKFAFAIAAKAANVDFQLDLGGDGWQALRNALPVRDRLTHPKTAADLRVADDDARNAMTAFDWVIDQMSRLAAARLLRRSAS